MQRDYSYILGIASRQLGIESAQGKFVGRAVKEGLAYLTPKVDCFPPQNPPNRDGGKARNRLSLSYQTMHNIIRVRLHNNFAFLFEAGRGRRYDLGFLLQLKICFSFSQNVQRSNYHHEKLSGSNCSFWHSD